MTNPTQPIVRPMRRRAEQFLRVLGIGALVLACWWSWRPPVTLLPQPITPFAVDSLTTMGALRAWVISNAKERSTMDVREALEVTVRAVPSFELRAALGALVRSGWPLVWHDQTTASGLAISLSRSARPSASVIVRVAAAKSARSLSAVVVRDRGGLIDSVPIDSARDRSGANAGTSVRSWVLASTGDTVRVSQEGATAVVAAPVALPASRILLYAAPGWESKFVVAALEASGWEVDARLRLSPRAEVTVGAPRALELRRYAAVIVLDSLAVDAAALRRFVAAGGGLVLAGDALQLPSLSALRAARPMVLRGAVAGALQTEVPRRGLERWLLAPAREAEVLVADTLAVGQVEPTVVALRRQQGRLLAVAYRESWRWRMQGTDAGVEAHRRWWDAVAAAAAGSTAPPAMVGGDPWPGRAAPYADLVALAGAPTSTVKAGRPLQGKHREDRSAWPPRLILFALMALLAEWGSRRLRGAH